MTSLLLYSGLLFPLPPRKLVEEKQATSNTQGHSSHNPHNTFIDNIIEEVSNDGKNPPPRFVKEIAYPINPVFEDTKNHRTNNSSKTASNNQFALSQGSTGNSTEISSPFSPDEIASERDPLENFHIFIEEISDIEDSNQPKSKLKQKEVQEVFKSPVSSLTLPAVATKLAKDIDENQKKFKNHDLGDYEFPIIDLSNLDIFRSFEPPSYKLLDEEETSILDGNKRKRNPPNLISSSENQKEFKNYDFNDHKPPIIELTNLDIFSDFELSPSTFFDEEEISSFDGNKKRKRNPLFPASSSSSVVVSDTYLE